MMKQKSHIMGIAIPIVFVTMMMLVGMYPVGTTAQNTVAYTGCSNGEKAPVMNAAFEDEVVRLTNLERSMAGLAPLSRSGQLDNSARYYAVDMVMDDYYGGSGHQLYDRVGGELVLVENCAMTDRASAYYDYGRIAENIAAGYRTPALMVEAWMGSESHRNNILNPDYTEIGVGYAWSDTNSYGHYWVQQFGTPFDAENPNHPDDGTPGETIEPPSQEPIEPPSEEPIEPPSQEPIEPPSQETVDLPTYTGCSKGEKAPVANMAFEQEVVRLINLERSNTDLPPLNHSPQLDNSARYHAVDMLQDDYFDHVSFDRINGELVEVCRLGDRVSAYYHYGSIAENIGVGYQTPADVVNGWMGSEGHRNNILNPDYTDIGIGYAWSGSSSYGHYWVQQFGTPFDAENPNHPDDGTPGETIEPPSEETTEPTEPWQPVMTIYLPMVIQ